MVHLIVCGKQVCSHVCHKFAWCKVNIYGYISGIAGITGDDKIVETSDILLFVIVKIFLGLKTKMQNHTYAAFYKHKHTRHFSI